MNCIVKLGEVCTCDPAHCQCMQGADTCTMCWHANRNAGSWISIPERNGYVVVDILGKRVLALISISEAGRSYLRVAGYHMGEVRWVGEMVANRLAIRVQKIPEDSRTELIPKIQEALPVELKDLPITYL